MTQQTTESDQDGKSTNLYAEAKALYRTRLGDYGKPDPDAGDISRMLRVAITDARTPDERRRYMAMQAAADTRVKMGW